MERQQVRRDKRRATAAQADRWSFSTQVGPGKRNRRQVAIVPVVEDPRLTPGQLDRDDFKTFIPTRVKRMCDAEYSCVIGSIDGS